MGTSDHLNRALLRYRGELKRSLSELQPTVLQNSVILGQEVRHGVSRRRADSTWKSSRDPGSDKIVALTHQQASDLAFIYSSYTKWRELWVLRTKSAN
jgi:hypothetical protein